MEPWQQRVVDEKAELDGKISRLSAFICGPGTTGFNTLSNVEKRRLCKQLKIMGDYSSILAERIAAFPK